MIVNSAWLAGHLQDPNLIVLAVGDEKEFASGHIPGARFLDYMETHYMTSPAGLTLELLPMAELERNFAKLGVSNGSRVVLYFMGTQFAQTTRVFLTLDAMGLGAQTSILDGGFPVWMSEGRPVTTAPATVKAASLKACPQPGVIADLTYVKDHMNSGDVRIVDARAPEYYSGAKPPGNKRLGHIPGAANLTYTTFFDEQGKI